MGNKYKYDVALSFAEEDKDIAEKIGKALKELDIKYYLYYEHNNLGKPLKEITWKIYHEESKLALVLISEHYNRKHWAREEREVIETVMKREGMPYLIPIRIDDTKIDGISEQIVYKRWTGWNEYEIAVNIFRLLKDFDDNKSTQDCASREKPEVSSRLTEQNEVLQKIDEIKGFTIEKVGKIDTNNQKSVIIKVDDNHGNINGFVNNY